MEEIKPHIDEDIYKEIKKQIDRFARIHPDSGDANQIQTYLEWVFDIPFGKFAKGKLKISDVKRELDNDITLWRTEREILEIPFPVKGKLGRKGGGDYSLGLREEVRGNGIIMVS